MKTDQQVPEIEGLVQNAIERHQAGLLRYALRLLGGDSARAREVVDGTFSDLKTQTAEEVEDELPEWLFAACRKRAFAVLQREGRLKRFEGQAGEAEAGASLPGGEEAETEEPHVTMHRLIERLTPKQQEAIRLKFQDGFGCKEIARITELSATNASLLLHNAVLRLGNEFRDLRSAADGGNSRPARTDDPRLTLYALDEMEAAERRNFENAILDKKAAAAKVDEIRATSALIGKTLGIEAGGSVPRPVRRRKAKRRRGLAIWLSFPRVLILGAGVFAVVGLGIYFFPRKAEAPVSIAAAPAVDFRLKAAPWQEQPAAAGATFRPDLASSGGGRAARVIRTEMPARTVHPPKGGAMGSGMAPPAETLAPPAERTGDTEGEVPSSPAATLRGENGGIKPVPAATASGAPPAEVPAVAESIRAEADEAPEVAAEKTPVTPRVAGEDHPAKKPVLASGGAKAEAEQRKFESPADAPVSHLPADVDTASVTDLRRSLAGGRWPAPGSVRVEQMLNYFPFAYAPPTAPADFAPALETAEAPWAPAHRLVRVALKAREAPPPARAAANLVLLIDTSGSMAAPNRLPLVKEAGRLLLGRLRPDDRVGIVTYAGESRLTLMPTPVAQARKILAALDRLEAGGLTNGGAGLELAYDLAKAHAVRDGVNCVILCTDGDFNVGPTSEAELTQLIDREATSAVQLSIFGFGRNGRIDPRLEALAAHGRGASGYVNTRREAEQVLTTQMNGLFEPLAKGVKVDVVFNPASVKSYHLIGFDDQDGARPADGVGGMQAGTVLPGQTLTALYEVEKADGAPANAELLKLRVRYQDGKTAAPRQVQFPCLDRAASFADASIDFKFAAAVAAFGMALREPPEQGMGKLDQVAAWGRECLGDDAGGYRSEFLAMVEQAKAARQ